MSTEGSPSFLAPGLQALRTAHSHHLVLTAMADLKASLLFGASLITLALSLGPALLELSILPVQLEAGESVRHAAHEFGFVALSLTALLVAFFSLRALTPRLLMLTQEDSKPEVNLLFCGHFSVLGENAYLAKLRQELATEEAAFDMLARDLYQMGLVLHQMKLRAVAMAITVATFGLIVTAVAAVVPLFLK